MTHDIAAAEKVTASLDMFASPHAAHVNDTYLLVHLQAAVAASSAVAAVFGSTLITMSIGTFHNHSCVYSVEVLPVNTPRFCRGHYLCNAVTYPWRAGAKHLPHSNAGYDGQPCKSRHK